MPDDQQLNFVRDEDFTSLYASNVQFESTFWDLKIIFGQVDLAKQSISQHTAMALSWPVAKLASYFMVANIIFHQAQNGYTALPPSVLPPRPDASDPGLDANGRKTAAYLAWVWDQFFGPEPYIPPSVEANSAHPPTQE
jgi:hypothetical protein